MKTKFLLLSEEDYSAMKDAYVGNPFFDPFFEAMLVKAFPYIRLKHFTYDGAFVVRVACIGSRVTGVPFSDAGDVLPLSDSRLPLSAFKDDIQDFFGEHVALSVNTGICAVEDPYDMSGDAELVDYTVSLVGESDMKSIFRKTLRHVLQGELPPHISIERVKEHKEIDRIYPLYLRHVRSVCNLAAPRELFLFAFKSPSHDIWVARCNGIICAFALFLNAKSVSHYSLSAGSGEAKKYHVPHHLLFAAMRHYAKEGKQRMFLGPTRVGSTLSVFKEGWRGASAPIISVGSAGRKESARVSPIRSLSRLVPLWFFPQVSKLAGKYLF